MINDIMLKGCSPIPLAHYLKALGIMRLVAEQADPDTRGYWRNERFVLWSKLDKEALKDFFLDEYVPTPVIAPWNGGSGFAPKDNQSGIRAIEESEAKRFAPYRETIAATRSILKALNIEKKVPSDMKRTLLVTCRAQLPEGTMDWLDSVFMLTDEKPKYPPLLGTGGNDGRLEFTNNFMQRLREVIIADEVSRIDNEQNLKSALFGTLTNGLMNNAPIGQFFPQAVGGPNSEIGYASNSLINPWDYIFTIEGTLLFASSCAKKLEDKRPGTLSYPFSVRSTGTGYGSASKTDEKGSRAEIWVPTWERPASYREIRYLMSEGRANISRRPARNGIDFARAIAGLGVDRGLSAFYRYGFQERNGLSYFATPMGCHKVVRQPQVDLLFDIDRWLDHFQSKGDPERAPGSVVRALRNLERAIMALCKQRSPHRVQAVLTALGDCEISMTRSLKWATDAYLRPVSPLSSRWLREADDGSVEFRLAASLASVFGRYKNKEGRPVTVPLRAQMEPVRSSMKKGKIRDVWFNKEGETDVVWNPTDLVSSLNDMMHRRILKAQQGGLGTYPDKGGISSYLGDISDFVEGLVDDERITRLLWGLILVDWPSVRGPTIKGRSKVDEAFPGASYALMKLCYAGHPVRDTDIPIIPMIQKRAMVGDLSKAVGLSIKRLRSSGLVPAVKTSFASKVFSRRVAASLLFPLNSQAIKVLEKKVLRSETAIEEKED